MIRLSLITLAGLFSAMLVWGTDSGEQSTAALGDSIGEPLETTVVEAVVETIVEPEPVNEVAAVPETVLPETNIATVVETAVDRVIAGAPEMVQEVTQLETLDLTSPAKPNNLIIINSPDAPRGEPLLNAVTIAAAETTSEAVTGDSSKILLAVNARSVNLRAGPSTNVAVVASLKRGEQAELVSEAADGWLQIRQVSTGKVGFMAGRFLDPVTQ